MTSVVASTSLPHKYEDGAVLIVGDKVSYFGNNGQVVFSIEEGIFLPRFRRENWENLKQGIGVELDDGTLFVLDEPDEDLTLLSRG